jgi:ribosome-associated translation inhibitor RaiA
LVTASLSTWNVTRKRDPERDLEGDDTMEISIQTSGLHLSRRESDALREHVHQRIRESFARIARRISHVSVHLEDVDGPRGGGHAMHCLVKVGIGGATAALAQGRDRNLFALVNRVSACAAGNTLKRLKRRIDIASLRKKNGPPDNGPADKQPAPNEPGVPAVPICMSFT